MPRGGKRRDADRETRKHEEPDELSKLRTIERGAFAREAEKYLEADDGEEPESDTPRGPSWRQALVGAIAAAIGLGVGVGAIALLQGDGGEETQEVADQLLVQGPVIPPLVAGPDPAVGQPAPVLEGETLGGEPITTEGTGRPRMLVFVAHWCTACKTELPRLVALADQGRLDDIDVVGISTSASPNRTNYPASDWLRREGWPYPTVADTAERTAARAYGATDLPYFLFIDAGGFIAGRASGPVSADQLTRIVDALASGQLAVPTTAPTTP